MTKILNVPRVNMFSIAVLMALAIFGIMSVPKAHASIGTQLSVGSKGSEVSQLQQFLATNSAIYPEALVTGYFGPLTRDAVLQFQTNYDIDQVGRVGPTTMARMNSVMNSGLGLDIKAPYISNLSVQVASQSATLNWSTDTMANGKVYYSTQPLQAQEANMSFTAPYVSGQAIQSNVMGYSQSITLPNLQSNTTYYYLVQATDASGNVSVYSLNTFHTNN